jgi:deoxyadenosine kinase
MLNLNRFKHINILGPIGIGKSTLAEKLATTLGARLIPEPVDDNPYLGDFYTAMADGTAMVNRIPGMMQLHLLYRRYENHMSAVFGDRARLCIEDSSIYSDTVFARMLHRSGHIDDRDLATYLGLYEIMKDHTRFPDLVIYLSGTADLCLDRIKKRSRGCESKISREYLADLIENYQDIVMALSRHTQVEIVDAEIAEDALLDHALTLVAMAKEQKRQADPFCLAIHKCR